MLAASSLPFTLKLSFDAVLVIFYKDWLFVGSVGMATTILLNPLMDGLIATISVIATATGLMLCLSVRILRCERQRWKQRCG